MFWIDVQPAVDHRQIGSIDDVLLEGGRRLRDRNHELLVAVALVGNDPQVVVLDVAKQPVAPENCGE